MLTFNTLRFANKLKAAGISNLHAEAKAEALAEVFEINAENLADKEDLKQLEARVDNNFELLRKDIQALELRINSRFEKVTGDTNTRFEKIDGKMLLLQWMMGFILVGLGFLILKAFF